MLEQITPGDTKLTAWSTEGTIGKQPWYRHSICAVPAVFSWEADARDHKCFTDVIAESEEEARATAEAIAKLQQFLRYYIEEVQRLRTKARQVRDDLLSDGYHRPNETILALDAILGEEHE